MGPRVLTRTGANRTPPRDLRPWSGRHAPLPRPGRRIGRAFVASGLTLVGGFGVLAFSPMPLVRDVGIVLALDVVFALTSTLVFRPPLLVWADGRNLLRRLAPPGG